MRTTANGLLKTAMWMALSASLDAGEPDRANYAISMIHESPMADPYVFKEGGLWHVYGTEGYALVGSDLAMGKLSAKPYRIDYPAEKGRPQMWGFHPTKDSQGRWTAVGTLHLGYYKTEIAAFEPQPGEEWKPGSPIGRWRLKRVLVPYESGKMATYETKVYRDTDGRSYLVYCRSHGLGRDVSIVAHRMLSATQLDPSAQPVVLLSPEHHRSELRNEGNSLRIVEGPNIVRINGYHILFYSVGDFAAGNYKSGFAYSRTLIPKAGETYRKVLVDDPEGVWGVKSGREVLYLLQSQHKAWPNYVGNQVSGPGLLNLVQANGKSLLVFHGHRPENPGKRMLWSTEVRVRVSDRVKPTEWFMPPAKGSGR